MRLLMRAAVAAVFGLMCLPTIVSAQTNYVIIPGYYSEINSPAGTTTQWNSLGRVDGFSQSIG
jgi:hypothetical protein